MSDAQPSIPRTPQSIARERVTEWFYDNVDKGAVLRLKSNSGTKYQLEIEPGHIGTRVGKTGLGSEGAYRLRRASVIRNGVKMAETPYVGLHHHSGSLGFFTQDMEVLMCSGSIVQVVDIDSVSPPRP